MTPGNIELFVDRLCGYFPTDSIARNTVKAAWTKEDVLLQATDHDGHLALNVLQNDAKFPNLARVKQVLRQWQQSRIPPEGCGKCLSGWVYIEPIEMFGHTYRQVRRCSCAGGDQEPQQMKEEWINA